MPPHNTPDRYGTGARLLHWLTALLLVGSFGIGFYMVGLTLSPAKLQLISWHKWIGVTVFALAMLRLAWRLYSPAPPLPAGMPRWELLAARASHALLYLLLFAAPLSGWLMSSAKGFQTVWFDVLPIPDLLAKDKELGDLLQTVHLALNFLLIAVLVGHVGAALKHHFLNKDDVLTRMLPRRAD